MVTFWDTGVRTVFICIAEAPFLGTGLVSSRTDQSINQSINLDFYSGLSSKNCD